MNFRFFNLLIVLVIIANTAIAQTVADTSFNFKINKTAYTPGKGPVILFDEFHGNPFSLKGQYSAFNRLLSQDGYVLQPIRQTVSAVSLPGSKIYVSVNAMSNPGNWDLPATPVYTSEEISAIYEWVKNGGSLFLITDEMPSPGSVNTLAQKFGFNLINGFAFRKEQMPELFSQSRVNLHESIITNAPGAKIDSLMVWIGTGFIAPKEATIISSLGDSYNVYMPAKASDINGTSLDAVPYISGMGLANGAFLKVGKGRVVLFADGAPFTALLKGLKNEKRGMNHPDAGQNAQFLLNIIHWLDGRL